MPNYFRANFYAVGYYTFLVSFFAAFFGSY
jgi:hypothetical protein